MLSQPNKTSTFPRVGEPFNPYGMFNGIWIPDGMLKCAEVCPSAKLVYGRLTRFGGVNGSCIPSIATLAAELGMTVRQVQRLIHDLCNAGFLRRDPRYRANGSQTSNGFVFLFHRCFVTDIPPSKAKSAEAKSRHLGQGVTNMSPRDVNVTGGVISIAPLEDSQLNSCSRLDNSSSSPQVSATLTHSPAADPILEKYPHSVGRFREFFPRTTPDVIKRILRAVMADCPDATDENIASSVYVAKGQDTPGLWAHTLPTRVRAAARYRDANRNRDPDCRVCKDAGVVWDAADRAAWCPAGCAAANEQSRSIPNFVVDWNSNVLAPRND
jgi:hypothetical protein